MKVLDPGHLYELQALDGGEPTVLRFVKRIGSKFPGNEAPGYGGTTLQEVIMALRDRIRYLDHQAPCWENKKIHEHLGECLLLLEARAARRHGRPIPAVDANDLEQMTACSYCLHKGCKGECGHG